MKHKGQEMISLAVISDDFTGALDTGVQFAKNGVSVKILTLTEFTEKGFATDSTDVLVVDAEMRHLSAEKAYEISWEFVARALQAGVPNIYIKTDSGLRGNIGSVLKAALETSGERMIAFLPAFPDMNRTTRNGMHYINEVPIHKSSFGQDPFEPVQSPYVQDLFKGLEVETVILEQSGTYHTDFERPTIGIFDIRTNDDFRRIAAHLKSHNQLKIVAGCAGFASVLTEFVDLPNHSRSNTDAIKPLLIVCGSLSPVTKRQVEYAHGNGFEQIELTPQQLLQRDYFYSAEGKVWLASKQELFLSQKPIVIDTGFMHPERMEQYDNASPFAKEKNRAKISKSLGLLMKQLLEMNYCRDRTLMIVGGDTMLGFIKQIHWQDITPVSELELGTVLTYIHAQDQLIEVVSKSGSFGEPDLLVKIAAKSSSRPKEQQQWQNII